MIDPTCLSACVLIIDFRGDQPLLLSVARKKDHEDWNLPGGKLDPEKDSCLADTAARELREETGLVSTPQELVPVFTKNDGHGFLTTTFLRPRKKDDLPTFDPIEGEAPVKWVHLLEICGPKSSFVEYNTALLEALGLMKTVQFPLGRRIGDILLG